MGRRPVTNRQVGDVHAGDGVAAIYDPSANKVIGATDQAWRSLAWSTVRDGRIDRLPAETFGELPPLKVVPQE
ncbi:hypothetical protein GCM10027184_06510 [Saccharothrix stipae]